MRRAPPDGQSFEGWLNEDGAGAGGGGCIGLAATQPLGLSLTLHATCSQPATSCCWH